jgi:hypothetical protein
MKSIRQKKAPLSRTATLSYLPVRNRGFEDPTQRAMNAVTLIATAAVIIILYAVMFTGLYRWNEYAPILPPAEATLLATQIY